MKKLVFQVVLISIIAGACSTQKDSKEQLDKIFTNSYRHYIISKGDNRPDFDRKKDSIDLFLIALHNGIGSQEFIKKAGWTDEDLKSKMDLLVEKGWLTLNNEVPEPTIFIATEKDGEMLYQYAKPLAEAIAASIEAEVPSIRNKFTARGLHKKYQFESLSFLILSDVLLDNWQIMNMEAAFLKQENRPARHNKFYYAAIEEYSGSGYEPFKIYGNQFGKINDSTYISIYGNNRIVANEKLSNNKAFCDSVLTSSLRLTPDLNNLFDTISADFRPKLLKILEDNREYSMEVFKKSGYAGHIKFEEFFIWWYHFIYTSATDILGRKNVLKIPEDGNFYYL
jgi:hypothetical protein